MQTCPPFPSHVSGVFSNHPCPGLLSLPPILPPTVSVSARQRTQLLMATPPVRFKLWVIGTHRLLTVTSEFPPSPCKHSLLPGVRFQLPGTYMGFGPSPWVLGPGTKGAMPHLTVTSDNPPLPPKPHPPLWLLVEYSGIYIGFDLSP